jgi:hypothetical protein
MFSKWFEERSEIRLQASFPKFAFGLWGRILRVSQNEIVLISDDKSETVLRLSSELELPMTILSCLRIIGAGGGNRTHGLGIMRPSLYH